MLIIAFLLVVTSLLSISSTPSVLLLYDISTPDLRGWGGESFEVLVTVACVKGNCGQEVKITVEYKSEIFELCEGDERPLEEQRADPISSQGYQFEFPKGQLHQANTLMSVLKFLAVSQIARLWRSRNQISQRKKWPLALSKYSFLWFNIWLSKLFTHKKIDYVCTFNNSDYWHRYI